MAYDEQKDPAHRRRRHRCDSCNHDDSDDGDAYDAVRASILMTGTAARKAAVDLLVQNESVGAYFPDSFFINSPAGGRASGLSQEAAGLYQDTYPEIINGHVGERASGLSQEASGLYQDTHLESGDPLLESLMARFEPLYCAPLGVGGVLKGLWDLGEALRSGMEVDIKKIPILQQTIEICELFHVDPYYADTTGSFLIAAYDAHAIEWELRAEGIDCSVIGILTASKARKIFYPRHTRYLDKPRMFE